MLEKLIRYTALSDRKYIDCFLQYNVPLAQAELVFSHILNTQHMWVSRICGNDPCYDRFHQHMVGDFEKLHLQNTKDLHDLVIGDNLDKMIEYQNTIGETHHNTVADILFNVVNHSTYHRGQIATQFKRHGITPPVTDYVVLVRDGEL